MLKTEDSKTAYLKAGVPKYALICWEHPLWQRQSFDIFEAYVYRLFNEKITSNPKTSNYRKINKKWDSVETS